MSMAKIEAMFAFQEANYYAVIELLQDESSNDYEVISMLGLSYAFIGDFMKAYVLFSHLFDSNRAIYKLPNENRRECNPLITSFYDMLNTFIPTQMNNMKKIRAMSTATIADTVFLNNAVTRYANNAKKYICGNDMFDIWVGLSFIELSMFVESNLFSRKISEESYWLKKALLEKLVLGYSGDVQAMFLRGYNCVSQKYKEVENSSSTFRYSWKLFYE